MYKRMTLIYILPILSIILSYAMIGNCIIKRQNKDFSLIENHHTMHDSIWRKTIVAYHENLIFKDNIVGLISLEFDPRDSNPNFREALSRGAIIFTPDRDSPRTIYCDDSGYTMNYSGVVTAKNENLLSTNIVSIEVKVSVRYTKDGKFKFLTDESGEAFGTSLRNGNLYINTDLDYYKSLQ